MMKAVSLPAHLTPPTALGFFECRFALCKKLDVSYLETGAPGKPLPPATHPSLLTSPSPLPRHAYSFTHIFALLQALCPPPTAATTVPYQGVCCSITPLAHQQREEPPVHTTVTWWV